jgi:phosphoglycerate kinase
MKLYNLTPAACSGKRVIMRADLNISLKNGTIADDYRLQAALPSLKLLAKHAQRTVLLSHLGRPTPGSPAPEHSLKLLVDWFNKAGLPVHWAPTIQAAAQHKDGIVLLENLRFWPGEQEQSIEFAKSLAQLGDLYVHDAFALVHRSDTSITLLPGLFTPENRLVGIGLARELEHLDHIKTRPQQPFVVVLGGNKLPDKIPLLLELITGPAEHRPQTILIGGALALPFLLAQGHPVGNYAIDPVITNTAAHILQTAISTGITIALPNDFFIQSGQKKLLQSLGATDICMDIGPETVHRFSQQLATAASIFANGTMGKYEENTFASGTNQILQVIATSTAYSVVGGGDCVTALRHLGRDNDINFVSTGGGATLAFLGTGDPFNQLPGLRALHQVG